MPCIHPTSGRRPFCSAISTNPGLLLFPEQLGRSPTQCAYRCSKSDLLRNPSADNEWIECGMKLIEEFLHGSRGETLVPDKVTHPEEKRGGSANWRFGVPIALVLSITTFNISEFDLNGVRGMLTESCHEGVDEQKWWGKRQDGVQSTGPLLARSRSDLKGF